MTGIIVFIKNPEKGKVKTRLAADVGDDKALEIYCKLLDHTRNTILKVKDVVRFLYYAFHINDHDEWDNSLFNKKLQSQGDLGTKMGDSFQSVLESHEKAIIIGSDCPEITPKIIEKAIYQLDQSDVVIGPTYDGGYYLLGMKSYHPELFEDMEWSTSYVFDETLKRANARNLTVSIIDKLSDVDYIEDWKKYGSHL